MIIMMMMLIRNIDRKVFEMFYSLRTLIISIVIGIITLFTIYIQISNSKSGYAPNLSTFDTSQVQFYDLANYKGSANGWQYDERVLFPLRDAAPHLPMFSLI